MLSDHRWVVVVVTFLVVAIALSLTLLQTPRYDATSEIVFVNSAASALSPAANQRSLDPARDIQTEIEVMTSSPIREMVKSALHASDLPMVSISPVNATNAIRITAMSSDPKMAARIANQYADTYLTYKRAQLADTLQAAGKVIQGRIAGLQAQIDSLNAQISAAPAAGRLTVDANVTPQRDALISQQTALQQQLDQSQVNAVLSDAGVQIGDRASVPASPSSPRPLKSGAYALVVGLCLGVGLVVLREFLDNSVKSKEDAERATGGAEILGLIPIVPGWKPRDSPVLASLSAPTSPAAEAYRGLRTALNFLAFDASLRLILVTSPSAGEGKTTTVANLAIAFGDTGQRVCVVSGDLRRPRIHEFFGLPNDVGLTTVVERREALADSTQRIGDADNVHLLAAGPSPLKPSELLASGRTEEVLRDLAEQFDIVLVDSPPVLPVTDASVLAGRVDGVLLVARTGVTKKRALARSVELLQQVGAPVLGLVINGAEDEVRYGYSSRYYGGLPSSRGDTRHRGQRASRTH
ncbi:MAG: tyrosine-protein kinase [Acidimicrobiaceae bacterium]|nr:tyrosine-protein kinase [Acidimicrobiaceae bacterium]